MDAVQYESGYRNGMLEGWQEGYEAACQELAPALLLDLKARGETLERLLASHRHTVAESSETFRPLWDEEDAETNDLVERLRRSGP